jgi:hypothetical protein
MRDTSAVTMTEESFTVFMHPDPSNPYETGDVVLVEIEGDIRQAHVFLTPLVDPDAAVLATKESLRENLDITLDIILDR